MSNKRLYAKIMRHLEQTSGTSFWDFRTLNLSHPQLAAILYRILTKELSSFMSGAIVGNHYLPRTLWSYN